MKLSFISEEDWAESTAYMMHEAFEASPPRRTVSPRRTSPPRRALSPRGYERPIQYNDDYPDQFRDQLAPFRDATFERRFRHESLERLSKDKPEKFIDESTNYRRRYIADTKHSNRSIDRGDDRRFGKLQRGASEGSLKVAEITQISPKDRFNVAKEKFMNLERERFNRELEQQMAIRRSMLERNSRSTSSPEEERRDERQERHRELSSRREPERSHRDIERSHREPERRKEERRERDDSRELVHREMERLPRVGRKRDDVKRYEYGAEEYLNRMEPKQHRDDFDRFRERERRELDRRIDEDEIIEPVIEDRRRDWTDRQRGFSRSRLLDDQRQSYAEGDRDRYFDRDYRDFRDLAERQPAKFRHSYAEPIPRGRLGTVRPY
jgi:hypothetical protein